MTTALKDPGTKAEKQVSQALVLECLAWILLIAVGWWWTLASAEQDQKPVIFYMSMLSLVSGVRVFIGHSGPRISATGLFALSASMFVGLSGLLLLNAGDPPDGWRNLALAVAASLTVASMLAWRGPSKTVNTPYWIDNRLASWFTWAGLLALGFATAVHF